LTNKERFVTALTGGVPDKVSIFDLEFNEASIVNVGRWFTQDVPEIKHFVDWTPEDRRKYFDVYFRIIRELDLDAISFVFSAGGERLSAQSDKFRDDFGVTYMLSEHGDPFPVDGPLKGPDAVKHLRFPEPRRYFDSFQVVKSALPDRAVIFCVPGPFKLSWSLMGGMEKLLLAYATDPEFGVQLSRLTTGYIKELIEISIEFGADVLLLDGDLASQKTVLMSPMDYRRYLKSCHSECVELSHQYAIPVFKHTDGNFWKIMDDLLEIGFDGLHPIQPQCMDIRAVKQHTQDKVCLLGNIDCAYLLPYGSEQEVVESVKQTIRDIAPGGGYILSSSNTIHPGCKPENVIAMFRAAREFGAYPEFGESFSK